MSGLESWVYVDECHAPGISGVPEGQPFRVGALVTEAPITQELVDRSLAALAADGEATGDRALTRGHLHASGDSRHAHSHLCRAIVDSKLRAMFRDTQWHFGTGEESGKSERELHWLVSVLGTMTTLDDDYDAVHLVVAERGRTLDRRSEKTWPAYLMDSRFGSLIRQPGIRMRFPRTTITIVDGSHPGIQVCDFVLWAVQRARFDGFEATGKPDWVQTQRGPQGMHEFSLGSGRRRPFLPQMGTNPREQLDGDQFASALLTMERCVLGCSYTADRGNSRIGHLCDDLAKARAAILDPTAVDNGMKAICRGFLLVCDTLPIYKSQDPDQHAKIIELRRIAADLLLGGNPRERFYLDFWRTERSQNERWMPKILEVVDRVGPVAPPRI